MKGPIMFRNKLVVASVAFALIGCARNGSDEALKIDSLQRVIDTLRSQSAISKTTADIQTAPPPSVPSSAPTPTAAQVITNSEVSQIDAYRKQWVSIRNDPEKAIGMSYEWTAQALYVVSNGDEVGLGQFGINMGIVLQNYN